MHLYKKVDPKGPRFRTSKYRYNLVNQDLHKRFEEKTGIKIPNTLFRNINGFISEEIREIAIEERDGVSLPAQMGNVWLGLFPAREKVINKKLGRREGIKAHYFSFDSSGMQGKIVWDFDKIKYKVKNREYFGFIGHRDFKTSASKAFLTNPDLYSRINKIIRRHEYKKTKLQINELNNQRGNKSGEDPA